MVWETHKKTTGRNGLVLLKNLRPQPNLWAVDGMYGKYGGHSLLSDSLHERKICTAADNRKT